MKTHNRGRMENVDRLVQWARSKGCYINEKLSFEYSNNHGISCIIKESLSEDDKKGLIRVPKSLIISPELADSFAKDYLSEVQTSSPEINTNLIFLLAKLKFDSSGKTIVENTNLHTEYQPYIDYLPNDGKSTGNPYFWTMEEKELLDGTDAHVLMKRNFLKDLENWKVVASQLDVAKHPQLKDELLEYEAFKMGPLGGVSVDFLLNVKEISWTSFTAYLWASCIISSRAFPYLLFDASAKYKNHAFLLPIVDLLNNEDSNSSKCRWTIENNVFIFDSLDDLSKLTQSCELYNNYGAKSNVEFLLNYGFCLKGNRDNTTTLSLKVDESVIEGAKNYGVVIPNDSSVNGINFILRQGDKIPENLIDFFSYLCKLTSERKGFNLRMKLEGLTQLKAIIKTKLRTLKKLEVEVSDKVSSHHANIIKTYRKSQKDIFQQTLEQVEKMEKQLLTEFKPFSFKKAMMVDTRFFNSFLVVFGTKSYNDLIEKGILDHAVLLWIMRISNKEVYEDIHDKTIFPDFIYNEFQKVKRNMKIDNDDIAEFMPMYQSLFPALCGKVPSVYNRGDWTLNSLIYAGTVADRLTYKRETNGEVFFIDPAKSK